MTVGTFLQPDHETQSGSIYKAAIDNSFAVLSRIGAMFAPHEQATPNMTIRVDAGALLANVTLSEIAAQSTATITAPTESEPAESDHRIDRVVIDAVTGAVSVITGTPGASPAVPAIPSGKLPICQVALAHGMTVITNDLITDERVISGGAGEAIRVNGFYFNLGAAPATELGYGTWSLFESSINPRYPLVQNGTYVKSTTTYSSSYYPYFCTDPAKTLIGVASGNAFLANGYTDQRLHIDLGSSKVITDLYYENYHAEGIGVENGAKNFTFWGSNDAAAFAELTYAINTNWTQLSCDVSAFVQHPVADAVDPHYVVVTNVVSYRYYAVKIADAYGTGIMGLRRFELRSAYSQWLRTA